MCLGSLNNVMVITAGTLRPSTLLDYIRIMAQEQKALPANSVVDRILGPGCFCLFTERGNLKGSMFVYFGYTFCIQIQFTLEKGCILIGNLEWPVLSFNKVRLSN